MKLDELESMLKAPDTTGNLAETIRSVIFLVKDRGYVDSNEVPEHVLVAVIQTEVISD